MTLIFPQTVFYGCINVAQFLTRG